MSEENQKVSGAGVMSAGWVLGLGSILLIAIGSIAEGLTNGGLILLVLLPVVGLFLMLYGFMTQVITLLKRITPDHQRGDGASSQPPKSSYRNQGYKGGVDYALQSRKQQRGQ